MQIESTSAENEWKVWLTSDELDHLAEHAKERSPKHYATTLLGGRVGLRAGEIAAMRYDHLRDEDGHYRLRVPEESGKDTTGTGGKARDAWVPSDAERELLRIRFELDAKDDEPLLGVKQRRVRQMVGELGDELAEKTGNPDWSRLSSHDLRRYYAQTLLVRQDINPHVVMTVGGWSSLDALTPYLTRPTDEQIRDEMVSAGWD
ncbi:bacterio-opsin activator-like protein [Haloferax mucosum ATCC BAA-1512]|uniref:Bacterio-opsin activator-like protein n=1 Tax=Haloferax mucosum ATCC BAA-1512 TaxID=662479 RepID=M0IKR7_9EURY|nr:site-specific integrase [Haloferax mucosum]ELZ96448.1 bacterio-opsin activator-like protein [Haloferax mucosum ATCC BAA-1512]